VGGHIGWLAERSEAALRTALRELRPDLASERLTLPPHLSGSHPDWHRNAAACGDDHLVKFAWSEPAAKKLWREARVITALGQLRPALRVPVVESVSSDPVLLVTRRLPGGPIWPADISAMSRREMVDLAARIAELLASLHAPPVQAAVESVVALPPPVPQATTDALRNRLGAFVDERRMAKVRAWCDWVDAVLSVPGPEVFLHGDFAGHNLLWQRGSTTIVGVVDFEEASIGDFHYDLRYLPSQIATLDLLHEVAGAYADRTGRHVEPARVMAWHVRTALGDTLWRSEARIALPSGGTPDEMVDETEHRLRCADVGIAL
jgi:aminoglycoside phosphotransferase (APT) family kinase protein